ncbi:uncharacterized GPI-anchored protein At5g19250-like [Cicer arietinum]|uniref:Uncharacterized GPI-anchored protein At5g19250-like n=1 Tax=Cicer arietinum TaxID=3827 RepID=A0A1S2XUA4_CICAR|nr:uncharacterized GPI-anchored protein At5g19250-like [Cicer arietinum]
MAFFKLNHVLLASVFTFILLSNPVHCSDKEDSVLKGINSYRQTKNLPPLYQNDKAHCLADEVADEIEDTPCEKVSQYYPVSGPGGNQRIPNLQKHIDKCGININTTADGVILPVCVSKLEPTIVLSNYTHSDIYAKFLNNSKYTGAGLGSEDDWMVLVLTTNTTAGTFSAATTSMHVNVVVLMAFMLVIINYLH